MSAMRLPRPLRSRAFAFTSILPAQVRLAPLLLTLLLTFAASACGDGTPKPTVTLLSIAVTPANPSITRGSTRQFTATGKYSDASTMDLTATSTWTSATKTTATISAAGLATGVAAGTSVISATATTPTGTITGMTTLTVTAVAVEKKLLSLAITPANPALNKGGTQQFTVTGTYDDKTSADLTATATWSSGTPGVATVSASGLATAVSAGSTIVTATSGGIVASTTLTVNAPKLVGLAVTPTNPSIAKGSQQAFMATGTFDDDSTQDLTATVTWSSDKPTVATVSAAGVATGVDGGTATITAQATGGATPVTGASTLTVTVAKLKSLAITPASPTIATGTKQTFMATGTFDDNTTQDLSSQVTWASATPATATISDAVGTKGQATAVAVGSTVISATLGAISDMTTLTVKKADLSSIAITPAAPSLAKGTKQKLTATGSFADGTTQDLTTQVTWASVNEGKVTVSNTAGAQGEITAVDVGTSVISAKLGTVVGTLTATVTDAKLLSLAVTPSAPSLARNTKSKLTATGTFSDGTTQDLTATVTWASATTATATISNAAESKGVVTAVAAGTSVISATSAGVSGMTTLTVRDVTLMSIVVTPDAPTLAAGTKQQLVATGFFSDATKQDLTETATWASMTTGTATVSNANGSKGLVTGVAVGTSRITATVGTVSDNTTLTVTAAVLTSIAITPATPSVAKGTKVSLVATATFSNGTTQNVTNTVTWASATPTVATVSNADGSRGQATAVAEGTSVVSATSGGLSATVTITVTKAVLTSLTVTPATPSIAKGTTQAFVATGTFSDDTTQVLTTAVTWSSSAPTKATISNAAGSNGVATALATGDVTITATSGAVSASTTLTINDGKLKSLAITPPTPMIAAGTSLRLVATGTFDDGATQDLTTEVAWASATTTVAKISSAEGSEGLATAVAKGTSVITATLGTVTGTVTLTVTSAQLVSLAIVPNTVTLAKGRTQAFAATGFFDDASTQDLTDSVTWTSTTPATASVSNADDSKGLATALAVGTTNIRAALGTVTGMASLRVTQAALTSLAITPATPSIAKGTRQAFTATGTFSDGSTQNLTTSVTWAAATPATASISNANGSRGLATALAVGTTDITATSNGVVGHATLTVTAATLVSLAVTPTLPSIARNRTQQFTATGTYTDGSTQNLTAMVTWSSSVEATATVSNAAATKGLATALAAGTTSIAATVAGATARTTLTVTP